MGKHRKMRNPSPPDRWQRGTFLVSTARLVLELIRWWNDGGPRL